MKEFIRKTKKWIRVYLHILTHPTERKALVAARQATYRPGQWHRWYKTNRRWQRQLSAARRLGVYIPPNVTGLPRQMVK